MERVKLADGREIGLRFEFNTPVDREVVGIIADAYSKAIPAFSEVMGMRVSEWELPKIEIGWDSAMPVGARGEFREKDNVVQIPYVFAKSRHGVTTALHELGHFFAYKALFGRLPVDVETSTDADAKEAEKLLTRYGIHEGIAIMLANYPVGPHNAGIDRRELAFRTIEMGSKTTMQHLLPASTICRSIALAAISSTSADEFLRAARKVTRDRWMLGGALVGLAILNNPDEPIGGIVRDLLKDPRSIHEKIKGIDASLILGYREWKKG